MATTSRHLLVLVGQYTLPEPKLCAQSLGQKWSSHCIAYAGTSTSVVSSLDTICRMQMAPYVTLVGLSSMVHPSNAQNHSLLRILRRSPAPDATKTTSLHNQLALFAKPVLLSESPFSTPTSTGSCPVVLRTYEWTPFCRSSSCSLANGTRGKCSSWS